MKLRKRFKKALFAFFKDEIMDAVGYSGTISHAVIKEANIIELKAEIILDRSTQKNLSIPIDIAYEYALSDAKKKLFEEAMKFIVIDSNSVFDPIVYPHRAIRLSLFVGKVK